MSRSCKEDSRDALRLVVKTTACTMLARMRDRSLPCLLDSELSHVSLRALTHKAGNGSHKITSIWCDPPQKLPHSEKPKRSFWSGRAECATMPAGQALGGARAVASYVTRLSYKARRKSNCTFGYPFRHSPSAL